MPVGDGMRSNPYARVCACGHTAHWHNAIIAGFEPKDAQGEGECEANGSCECKRFAEDKTDSYESLRRERDEALTKLEDLEVEVQDR